MEGWQSINTEIVGNRIHKEIHQSLRGNSILSNFLDYEICYDDCKRQWLRLTWWQWKRLPKRYKKYRYMSFHPLKWLMKGILVAGSWEMWL